MTMSNIRPRNYLAALAIAAILAGCGGSDSNNGPGGGAGRTTDVPSSAQGSLEGLLAYMNDLIKTMTNDTSEPILVGDAVLPTSDTVEPAPVNP
jgi:hypothetical protein